MSIRNLQHLFAPRSVVLVGSGGAAAVALRNLQSGRLRAALHLVDPAAAAPWSALAALPAAPDLALVCAEGEQVPAIIRRLGELGTRAAIVLSSVPGQDARGRSLRQAMLDAANPYLLRILGPDSIGLQVPGLGLNASIAPGVALPGRIAFVSQSGALMTGVLDWARSRGIGFSAFVSLGDSADVDLGDVLDYLATDGGTSAILLHVERVRYARKFMSAARAAARSKPTLVLKAGRVQDAPLASATTSGQLAGVDEIYDAAIRRAGMLRVFTTEELFAAVETLAHARPLQGERLAILGNGGGPALMAADALAGAGGMAARLSPDTIARLNTLLPAGWSGGNPVELERDAPPERYRAALEVLLQDSEAHAVLVIHSPAAGVDSTAVAEAVAPLVRQASRNLLSCWLGGDAMASARGTAAAAGLPAFGTPEDAVAGFLQIVRYRQNQQLLMQVPPSVAGAVRPDRERARELVRQALAEGRHILSDPETKAILRAYGIGLVETRRAHDLDEAVRLAGEIGLPVALKVLSPDVVFKSDVGGVALDLDSPDAVRAAGARMQRRLAELRPDARFDGFAVQAMARRPQAHELLVGVATDLVMGPVIVFGQGGEAAGLSGDHAVALPPLNHVLACDLIERTRVSRLLEGYRGKPAANMDAIVAVLVQVARLVGHIPELVELDINPLLVDGSGAVALDTRMRLAMADSSGSTLDRLAIRPYPRELEQTVQWQGRPLLLRPIRPEDGPAHMALFAALTPDDVRYRMFVRMRELGPSQLARFTQIDYDREMAFIATRPDQRGEPETLAVARVVADPDNVSAEFAVTVRSDLKGQGLGRMMMKKLIDYCRSRGTREIVGEALPQNARVIGMVKQLGFEVTAGADGVRKLRLPLQ